MREEQVPLLMGTISRRLSCLLTAGILQVAACAMSPGEATHTGSPARSSPTNGGSSIAYLASDGPGKDDTDVFVLSLRSMVSTPLTALGSAEVFDPKWSPDRGTVAFGLRSGGESEDIYAVGADGHDLRQLAAGSSDQWSVSWSPDGHEIAYLDAPSATEPTILKILDLGDGSISDVRTFPVGTNMAAWDPSGAVIAVVANGRLWFQPASGGTPKRGPQVPGDVSQVSWSPTGELLVSTGARHSGPPPWPRGRALFVANGESVRLLEAPRANFVGGAWAPSGGRLVLQHLGPHGKLTLDLVSSDGRVLRSLVEGWDPD